MLVYQKVYFINIPLNHYNIPLKMVIFHSHVSLPEAMLLCWLRVLVRRVPGRSKAPTTEVRPAAANLLQATTLASSGHPGATKTHGEGTGEGHGEIGKETNASIHLHSK